jgi:hypothetical protein
VVVGFGGWGCESSADHWGCNCTFPNAPTPWGYYRGAPLQGDGTDDREMTAVIWHDTLSRSAATKGTKAWQFKLDMERDEEDREAGSRLTNEDTVTSSTSIDTLLLASTKDTVCRGWRTGDPVLLEDYEIGPPPRFNTGPLFAVGEVIMCNVPGHPLGVGYISGHPHGIPNGLQRSFVLQAKHPRYQICLENGQTVWTHMGESWLCPRYAPGEFAEDQDNPFADLHTDTLLEFGSYGMHTNAQWEALEKVADAKAFAKAVKADDAEVPVYLWNERIRASGVMIAKQDAALTVLWKLGHRWFLCRLVQDCIMYLHGVHGANWLAARWKRENRESTEIGKDQEAITGTVWHNTHTNWFEFHAGSCLVHLRFPLRYQKEQEMELRCSLSGPGLLLGRRSH